MSKRKPNKEELELWGRVADTAVPMHPKRKAPLAEQVRKNPTRKIAVEPIMQFELGVNAKAYQPSHDITGDIRNSVAKAPVQMDRKKHTTMKRYKLKPEAKLDLHGLTQAEAHPRLNAFILRACSDGKRLVLVVTGKGKARDDGGPIPVRFGVLRHQVPHWLSTPPLAQVVMQVSQAHLRHGGGGAYYVYLRRQR